MAKNSINDEELDIIKELQKLDQSELQKLDSSERFKYIYAKVPSLQKYHLKKGIKGMVKDLYILRNYKIRLKNCKNLIQE